MTGLIVSSTIGSGEEIFNCLNLVQSVTEISLVAFFITLKGPYMFRLGPLS